MNILTKGFLIFIFIFRLKCNERLIHDEEFRMLRKKIHTNDDYRTLIAKQDAEILVRFSFYFDFKNSRLYFL